MLKVNMEAGAGIEPANNDFADRRLTTYPAADAVRGY